MSWRSRIVTPEVGGTSAVASQLVWQCDGPYLNMLVTGTHFIEERISVEWSVEGGSADDARTWERPLSGDGWAAPPEAIVGLTNAARSEEAVLLRVTNGRGTHQELRFSTVGLEAALHGLYCGTDLARFTSILEVENLGRISVEDVSERPTFIPFRDAPEVLNRDEIVDMIEQEYPELVQVPPANPLGGPVPRVFFLLDEYGRVHDRRLEQSSGDLALDRAGLSVARWMRFGPALDRGKRTPVWVSFGITAESLRRSDGG